MKIPFAHVFMACALSFALCARAQTPTSAAPVPPFVARVAHYAHWTVTLKYPPLQTAEGELQTPTTLLSNLPIVIDVTKTGNRWQVIQTFSNGTSQQFDQIANYILIPSPSRLQVMTLPMSEEPYSFYSTDYLFVARLRRAGLSAYKDVVKVNEVTCFHYQDKTVEAWIRVGDLLPIKALHEGIEADFQYHAPPSQPLVFSPAEENEVQARTQRMNAVSSVR